MTTWTPHTCSCRVEAPLRAFKRGRYERGVLVKSVCALHADLHADDKSFFEAMVRGEKAKVDAKMAALKADPRAQVVCEPKECGGYTVRSGEEAS